jgi:hypothetical protein
MVSAWMTTILLLVLASPGGPWQPQLQQHLDLPVASSYRPQLSRVSFAYLALAGSHGLTSQDSPLSLPRHTNHTAAYVKVCAFLVLQPHTLNLFIATNVREKCWTNLAR